MEEAVFRETSTRVADVEFRESAGALLVSPLVRELDASVAPRLRDVIGDRAQGRSVVVLSLAHVARIDPSGLAALVAVLKRMAPGGELRLVDASGPVRALLEATHLDELFPLFEDPAAALPP